MKVTNIDGIDCIYLDEIQEELTAKEYDEFGIWFAGQTGLIHKGRMAVYEDDYRRWLEGGKNE